MLAEDQEKPLVAHLAELRTRILIVLFTLGVTAGIGYLFAPSLISVLLKPLPEKRVIFLGPLDALLVRLRIALYSGVVLSFPQILFQLWRFIVPALRKRERLIALVFVFVGPFLFLGGGLFAFFLLPFSLRFLLGIGGAQFVPMLAADRYFAFFTNFALVFGLVFQLPLISFLFSALGLITPEFLAERKQMVIVLLALLAALITPPDVFTMIAILVPLIFLYEVSILIARVMEKRWKKSS